MGLMTALLVGGALGAGYLAGRKKDKPQPAQQTIAPGPTGAENQLAATNPPNASRSESQNVSTAVKRAARTRKRAGASTSGKVTTGPVAPMQRTVTGAGNAPRMLLGY